MREKDHPHGWLIFGFAIRRWRTKTTRENGPDWTEPDAKTSPPKRAAPHLCCVPFPHRPMSDVYSSRKSSALVRDSFIHYYGVYNTLQLTLVWTLTSVGGAVVVCRNVSSRLRRCRRRPRWPCRKVDVSVSARSLALRRLIIKHTFVDRPVCFIWP